MSQYNLLGGGQEGLLAVGPVSSHAESEDGEHAELLELRGKKRVAKGLRIFGTGSLYSNSICLLDKEE
jgi:hypothetical protein